MPVSSSAARFRGWPTTFGWEVNTIDCLPKSHISRQSCLCFFSIIFTKRRRWVLWFSYKKRGRMIIRWRIWSYIALQLNNTFRTLSFASGFRRSNCQKVASEVDTYQHRATLHLIFEKLRKLKYPFTLFMRYLGQVNKVRQGFFKQLKVSLENVVGFRCN